MDNTIKATLSSVLAPVIDQIKQQIIAEAGHQEGKIPRSRPALEQQSEQLGKELESFIIGEEEIDRLEKGFERVLKELENTPQQEHILNEIKHAAERLASEPEDTEEFELPIFDTVQEMLGFSDETFETIYRIGSDYFNTGKMEEARDVFVLLTSLNNLVFEPWLGLGSCRQHFQEYPEALHAFTMASLLDFENPVPHLYAAEVYLHLQANELAKETLELALSKMSEGQKGEFRPHIQFINQELRGK